MREVFVASSVADVDSKSTGHTGVLSEAQAAADWLDRNLREGQTLGLFWAGTVRALVDLAHFGRPMDVHVVQLGEWSNDPERSGHDLVRELAIKLGGRCTYFNAPAFTATDADTLLSEPQAAAALNVARSADLCVLGVGTFLADTTTVFLEQATETEAEIAEARAKGTVGQLAGRFFDADGKQVDLALHRRIVSLDLKELRDSKTIVVVASGAEKCGAVMAAIRESLVDVLICDSELAAALARK